jgi:3-deoxy-manno-octulosonate cytidylyltransferase (CMP-KDO synthetase)
MNVVAFIPARMAATRFPGKPLVRILEMPMVEHVYWRSKIAASVNDAWVCTCDEEIFRHIESVGGQAVMTSDTHERASDRMAEALLEVEAATGQRVDLAVLVQGDEPMVMPEMLDQLIEPALRGGLADVYNLIEAVDSDEEFHDPNCVKVVVDRAWNALYLSREPIPSGRKFRGEFARWKQLGLIAFTREAILGYAKLEPTSLEIIESVDVNRLLEHGRRLQMIPTEYRTKAVDHPADVAAVEALMLEDPLVQGYIKGGGADEGV